MLPLLSDYSDHELLQQPVFDPNANPATAALARAAPPDKTRRTPWAAFVCAGTDRNGGGFGARDMTMLREWARLCAAPLRAAGLLDGS